MILPDIAQRSAQNYIGAPDETTVRSPTANETFDSSMFLENDVQNLLRPIQTFKPQPGFDFINSLKTRGVWDDRELYFGVKSDAEVDYKTSRIAAERRAQDIRARSGWLGYATDMAAGTLSPTVFIPFVKGATVGGSMVKGAISVAAGAAAQEAALFASQETRTKEQAVFSVAASLLMGGILGSAGHGLHPKDLEQLASGMDTAPRATAISEPHAFSTEYQDAGAASSHSDPGRLKSNAVSKPVLDQMSKMGPITRGIQQPDAPAHMPNGSPTLRIATAKFAQGGLKLEGNVSGKVAAEGGNIQSSLLVHAGNLDTANRVSEEAYRAYIFGENVPTVFANSRAKLAGFRSLDKMDFPEFKRQVFLAMHNEDQAANPFVQKAAEAYRKHITNLADEAVKVNALELPDKVTGAASYVTHLWDKIALKANTLGFIKIAKEHYEPKLQADFQKGLAKLQEKQAKSAMFITDAQRSAEEVQAYTDKFKQQLQDLENNLPFDTAQIQLEAINLRAGARKIKGMDKTAVDARQATLDMAAKVEAQGGDTLKEFQAKRADIRARLRNLSTAGVSVNKRFEAKLAGIERNEQLQVDTIYRGAKQAQKLLALVSKGTDQQVADELSKFKTYFAKTAKAFDHAEEQIGKLADQGKNPELFSALDGQEARIAKMDKLAAEVEALDIYHNDPKAKKAFALEVDAMAKDMLEVHAQINAKRAVRNEKLRLQAQKLSPEEFAKKLELAKMKAAGLVPDFRERMRMKGADNVDLEKGTADFTQHVEQTAQYLADKLLGMDRRLAYSDIIQDKRGPELRRMIDIPAEKALPFLESDIHKVMSTYTRTIGADTELARAFGSADMAEVRVKLGEERNKALAEIPNIKDKKGNPIGEEKIKKLTNETNNFYIRGQRDLDVLLERTRGVRGLPTDPYAMSSRLSKTVLMLNGLRYLGGAMLSSVSDPARIVQRHGLLNTFKDGFIPFITAFREAKMSAWEARLAGEANDIVTHTRLNTFNDIYDDNFRGTIFERGIQYLSNNMGNVAGFNQWTQAMKQMSAVVINARIINSIGLMLGEKGSQRNIAKASEFLASVNIDPETARVIWGQVTNGKGGGKQRGVWLPSTEEWDISQPAVKRALHTYRAALAGEIGDTIITPGMERPNWVDSGIMGRHLAQFKSFAMSSTQKTLMAGLQEHDMAYVNGLVISLALGAFSYYTYAKAAGGAVEAKMLKTIDDGNWAVWADEAISRSGQTAIFDSLQRAANRLPILNKYSSFSGGPVTKKYGGGLVNEIGGPSLDMLVKLNTAMTDLDKSKPNMGIDTHTAHLMRQLLPFQNVFYTRYLLDQIENASTNAFGLKGKRQ